MLFGAVVAVTARHRAPRLSGWVRALGSWSRKLVGSLATLRYDPGGSTFAELRQFRPHTAGCVDDRISPCLVGRQILAIGAWIAFPTGWRAVGGLYPSYTLYFVFLMLLWVTLLAVTFVGVFIPVAYLDKWLKQWLGDTDRRGADWRLSWDMPCWFRRSRGSSHRPRFS